MLRRRFSVAPEDCAAELRKLLDDVAPPSIHDATLPPAEAQTSLLCGSVGTFLFFCFFVYVLVSFHFMRLTRRSKAAAADHGRRLL